MQEPDDEAEPDDFAETFAEALEKVPPEDMDRIRRKALDEMHAEAMRHLPNSDARIQSTKRASLHNL